MTDQNDRLEEEEEELRKISPIEGAMGRNGSDYKNLYDMFLRLFEDAATMRANPKAFINESGQYNDKIINAYAKLMGLAMKGIESLNRMRNNDRMVEKMLDGHAKEFAQYAAVELGVELKNVIDSIDRGASSDEIVIRLKKMMHKRIPEIFLRSATVTLQAAKEEHGLLN